MDKKSQGLSINVIIIAVIALVVLVVIIAIFTGTIGKTAKNIGSCVDKGGDCADKEGKCPDGYPVPIFVSGDCEETTPKNKCCFKIKNE